MSYNLGHVSTVSSSETGHEFKCENGRFIIQPISEGIIRFQATFTEYYREYPSVAVPHDPPIQQAHLKKTNDIWEINFENYAFAIQSNPFAIRLMDSQGSVVFKSCSNPLKMSGTRFEFSAKLLGSECFYGMGEKAHGLNKRGLRYEMWNTDNPSHDIDSDPLYQSIPFFITLLDSSSFGVFLDNTYRSFFDFGKTDPSLYYFGAPNGPIDIYFILGPSIRLVVDRYTRLTGRPHFVPRWALGHQHSRWMEYKSEEDILSIAHGMREYKIPCDTIVLDIGYMDEFRIFTWNSNVFPNPDDFTDKLASLDFRVMSIIDPGVKLEDGFDLYDEGIKNDYFLKRSDGDVYVGLVWPGETVFPDFSKKQVRDWFSKQYQKLAASGLSNSSWLDMNEPSYCIYQGMKEEYSLDDVVDEKGEPWEPRMRNAYAMGMIQAAFNGLRAAYPNQRPFLLTRSGYAGYQRYSAMWTGDNQSKWEHLWLSIPMLLNLGLSGIPFCGADIGGFGGDVSDELLARWYQLGAFYPFSRNHSMINTRRQEPWLFDDCVLHQARRYLELRYELLRYLYSLAYESSKSGIPIMRPLVFEFQDDSNTYELDRQFMLGPFILIAPVLEPDVDTILVYLPEGVWYDFWTSKKLVIDEGGSTISVSSSLDNIPIYSRGGTILPTGRSIQHTNQNQGDLIVVVYPGHDSDFCYFEDDGLSETGAILFMDISLRHDDSGLHIEFSKHMGDWAPPPRDIVLEIRGLDKEPAAVRLDNSLLDTKILDNKVQIRFSDDGAPHIVDISV
ncbi:MAG: DUF4968 domain-containing protein [Candidatus Lokiarchaeota archaeon]|nr:DUF4968 domain-containing protein [Candidatus Lokiarchaeota archaeon]